MLVYRPPSLDALMCRRAFFTNSKVSTESTTEWFERVANSVNGCEFENFADIMLIDKFLSGLDETVYGYILKEISFDSHQALLLALSSESLQMQLKESATNSAFVLKTEIEVEDQDNVSNWFDNDVNRWTSDDDDVEPMKTEFINLPMVDDVTELETPISMRPGKAPATGKRPEIATKTVKKTRIVPATEEKTTKVPANYKKPTVMLKKNKVNGESGTKVKRQKRDDFVINDRKRFECLQCHKSYGTRKLFRRHYMIHTDSCLPCPKCGKVFATNPLLRRHMFIHDERRKTRQVTTTDKKTKRDDFEINDQKRFECLQCHKSYATRKLFRRHYNMHTESCLPCPKCGKLFATNPLLRRHMSIHDSDEIRNLECYICRLTFLELCGLRVHMGKEHQVVVFSARCDVCNMKFNSQARYNVHMQKHKASPVTHVCEFCGKNFHIKANWRRHLLIHTNLRNHTCEKCGKGYTRKDRLRTHMLIHTGERPHQCRFCPKKFRLTKDAQTHERTHTGEKPYKCLYQSCDKAFARHESFMRHKRMHAQIRPFPCQMCEKKFATKYHMQRHMSVHTGQKPYCCELCGNRFTQLGSLGLHKINVHGVVPGSRPILVKPEQFEEPGLLEQPDESAEQQL